MYFQGYGGPESHLLPPKPGTWLSSTAPQLSWLGGALDAPAPPGTCLEEVITGSALLGGAQHITPLWGCQPFLMVKSHGAVSWLCLASGLYHLGSCFSVLSANLLCYFCNTFSLGFSPAS